MSTLGGVQLGHATAGYARYRYCVWIRGQSTAVDSQPKQLAWLGAEQFAPCALATCDKPTCRRCARRCACRAEDQAYTETVMELMDIFMGLADETGLYGKMNLLYIISNGTRCWQRSSYFARNEEKETSLEENSAKFGQRDVTDVEKLTHGMTIFNSCCHPKPICVMHNRVSRHRLMMLAVAYCSNGLHISVADNEVVVIQPSINSLR